MMFKKAIFFFLCILPLSYLYAENTQSLELLKQKIEAHVHKELSEIYKGGELSVSAQKIDERLHLKACPDSKIEVFNPYKTAIISTTTMAISCHKKASHWTLYVPIKVSFKKEVLVASKTLHKGKILHKSDLIKLKIDISQLKQGYFTKSKYLIGKVAKQNIGEGTALTPQNIQEAILIHKGEQITIQAINDMINISMNGIALNNGALGEVIKVQNLNSKKVIDAEVSSSKTVRVVI